MYKLKIGGEDRHIDFSMSTLALFCREEGKDFSELAAGLNLDLLGLIKLVYWGLVEGAERNNKNLPKDFNWRVVGDWFTEDPDAAGRALKVYYESQGIEITEKEEKKAKKLKA